MNALLRDCLGVARAAVSGPRPTGSPIGSAAAAVVDDDVVLKGNRRPSEAVAASTTAASRRRRRRWLLAAVLDELEEERLLAVPELIAWKKAEPARPQAATNLFGALALLRPAIKTVDSFHGQRSETAQSHHFSL
jgi:hypothetical protein